MTILWKIFLNFFILYQVSHFSKVSSYNITVDELSVGEHKNYAISREIMYIIEIRNLSDVIEKVPPRIFVKCEDCNENDPLLIVASQNKGVISWELPVVIEINNYRSVYKNTERTLCPYDIIDDTHYSLFSDSKNQLMKTYPGTLSLSSSSIKNVSVELVVNLEQNFVINLNMNKSVKVTPSTPAFYLFEFKPENVSSVLLHITSEDDICLIVSIQNVSCPVFDLEENVGYRGFFQTVTRQGGFTLTKESFPEGFYVVLIASSNDKYCSNMLVNSALKKREKSVVISLSKTIGSDDYKIAVGITVLVIVFFCSVMFVIFFCSIKRGETEIPTLEDEPIIEECEASTSASHNLPYNVTSPVTPVTPVTPITPAPNTPGDTLSIKTDSSLDETDFDLLKDGESDKHIFRMKSCLFLCDTARKNQSVLRKKSELYFWILLTVGIFYFLPVVQLVFTDQYRLNQSGKEDICYYNFLCSHPLWWFSDFNHMFSNIGYISFGMLFIFLTVLKERNYQKKIDNNKKLYRLFFRLDCRNAYRIVNNWNFFNEEILHKFLIAVIDKGRRLHSMSTSTGDCQRKPNILIKNRIFDNLYSDYPPMNVDSLRLSLVEFYGVPQHFGIFYAMGAALIFEGILSLCYHICPNHYNFQFDTSFMYVICTLCMIKIYQSRHPDINANANATFSLLAGVIFLGMYGVFSSNLTFWILFTILHLFTCIYLSLHIYYMRRIKFGFLISVRWLKELQACRACQFRYFLPSHRSRFALLVVANACNWGLAIGSFVYNVKNFSSYLLIIFMVNLLLYTAFYILMKFICKERLPLQSVIYILLAVLCWSAALYFFLSKTISWRLTPAESKLYNQKCKLFDFYDNHDIWHFISAAAMFFSFMVLLTLDDDLIYVQRSKIVVF